MIHFDISGCERKIKELEESMNSQDFWNDIERSQKVNREIKNLRTKTDRYKKLVSEVEDIETLIDLAIEENDDSVTDEVKHSINILDKEINALILKPCLTDHTTGTMQLFLSMPAQAGPRQWIGCQCCCMYTRWCEDKGYEVKVLDMLPGEEAGIKSVIFHAIGPNAYGYLRCEKGVHRLVRISPFDASGRRHTSFASVDVMPELEDDTEIEIKPEELKIDTYRSGGAGGQHVNKTESAVRITHIPTGIVVQCQNERSQIQNRETAMKVLKARLLELKERENEQKIREMKGEMKRIEWGSQIRSYVFHPYSLVKDHRTGMENGNIQSVMDGELDGFINAYLQANAS